MAHWQLENNQLIGNYSDRFLSSSYGYFPQKTLFNFHPKKNKLQQHRNTVTLTSTELPKKCKQKALDRDQSFHVAINLFTTRKWETQSRKKIFIRSHENQDA